MLVCTPEHFLHAFGWGVLTGVAAIVILALAVRRWLLRRAKQ